VGKKRDTSNNKEQEKI